MKLSEKSTILLERYLLAVERRLPWQGRKDMISEIKANFLDKLEDQYAPEEVISETDLEAELRKLGSPRSVAASYRPSDALIGPQHNMIFRLIVMYITPVVVSVVFFAGLLSFIISGGESPFWSIWELISTAWQVAVGIIGTSAIVFMILTRYFPQVNQDANLEFLMDDVRTWKVSDLPELVEKQDKIKLWEPIVGIIFGAIWLVLLLIFFDKVAGIWWLSDDKWHMVPIFTDTFKAFIPWIAVNTGLDILVNVLLVYQQRQGIASRAVAIVIKLSEIALIAAMLRAGNLINFDASLAIANGFPAEAVTGIETLFAFNFVHWFLIFLLVVLSIDLIKKCVELGKSVLQKTK